MMNLGTMKRTALALIGLAMVAENLNLSKELSKTQYHDSKKYWNVLNTRCDIYETAMMRLPSNLLPLEFNEIYCFIVLGLPAI